VSTDLPVAVVSGGNRGIGLEVVRQLADRGHLVVLGSRDLAKGQQAAGRLDPAGDRVVACRLDVADQGSVTALGAEVERRFGRADVLVNNAAILYDTWARAATADLATVREAMETNLYGAWRLTQALLPLLRRAPHPRVVNVSSEGGSLASMSGGTPAYSVSKAALNALTRELAGELRRDRILVNAICPGWVATDMGGPGGRPVRDGAAGIVWAATLPDTGPTGGFFRDGRPLPW
jgi:NAD(P)-dependent dehydrogenase (short-subunit alcohol dehydrogenase family)